MKTKHFIDIHKGATALVVFAMLAAYAQWDNPTAWLYLALHGSYGVLWVLKSRIFPDKQWEQPATLAYGLVIWAGLSLYWVGGWIVMAYAVHAPLWWLALCVSIYAFGIFFHFAADMQKHTALQLRPGHLITDGLFAYSRNPNYFGELLIYAGFGLLAVHWLADGNSRTLGHLLLAAANVEKRSLSFTLSRICGLCQAYRTLHPLYLVMIRGTRPKIRLTTS